MAHKQLLHELLKEDQEPFHLKSYISDRRSQLKKSTNLQIKKRKSNISSEISTKRGTNLSCFFSFQNYSPDVRKSPIIDFHVPSKTADLLVEAAMRIQKRSRPKPVGLGLIGSFLKILKDRSKDKKRAIGGNEFSVLRNCEVKGKETREGLNRGDVASASTCWNEEIINGDFAVRETRFCSSPVSPFRFSLHKSASSSGRHTPDFCSPAASPSHCVKQEKENCTTGQDSDNALHVVEEEKEQSSPVSVLDPFFEDDGHESVDPEEGDDYDLECSYANVQRAKEQLLYRLRRFEKLAELDPMELEKNMLEDSDDDYQIESVESEHDNKPILSLYRKQSVETFVNEMFSLQHNNSRKMSTDNKKNKIICLGKRRFVLKEVEFDTIDTMVELDLTIGFDGRKNIPEQVEETAAELELAIFGVLVEELSEEFCLQG